MHSLKIVFLILLFVNFCQGQISITNVANKVDRDTKIVFDSTENFLGVNAFNYIGQTLYLPGKELAFRQFGYDRLYIDYKKSELDKNNIYKCGKGFNSNYDELNNKYFLVLDVISGANDIESEIIYGKIFYFKLEEKDSKDILYYKYFSKSESSFDFILVSFYEKLKLLSIGNDYVCSEKLIASSTDVDTGKPIANIIGESWKCLDVTIDNNSQRLSLLLKNKMGNKVLVRYSSVLGTWALGRTFKKSDAKDYIKKFGNKQFENILQGKCIIGMTKEMCKLAWGEPNKINETIYLNKNSEQWVYSDNYLYFDNGKLIAIQ